MRIFCLILFISLLGACSNPDPTPNVRGVTVVPRSPVPTENTPEVLSSEAAVPSVNCPDAPDTRLIVQERGRSTANTEDPINLRNGPGTTYDVITRIETGELFFVLDGPSCAEGYAWFYVRYRRNGRDFLGWLAEGTEENYFVEPYLQG